MNNQNTMNKFNNGPTESRKKTDARRRSAGARGATSAARTAHAQRDAKRSPDGVATGRGVTSAMPDDSVQLGRPAASQPRVEVATEAASASGDPSDPADPARSSGARRSPHAFDAAGSAA
ncbi:hypothetical protein ACX841_24835, partial [Burkholderia pseudomallei]